MLIFGQFYIIQNIQTSPISQTCFFLWTFFAASLSKIALAYPLNSSPIFFLQTQYSVHKMGETIQIFEVSESLI